MGKKLDLRGQKFTRLTVISEAGRSKAGKVLWLCRCDCGTETIVSSDRLRNGNTTSCGCFKHDRSVECNTKHGLRKHPLYSVWHGMMQRTGVYKGAIDRVRFGYIERGITVCDEWRDFPNFYNWAITHGYERGKQLDRADNDGSYEPSNCRFVTPKKNCNNKRNTVRLSNGTPLAEFMSSFGIATSDGPCRVTKEYARVYRSLKKHGEQSATMLVFDIALEQIANKAGFEYVKIQSSISNQ